LQKKPLEKILGKLSKKPKPKPVVLDKKNETKAENETNTTEGATQSNETNTGAEKTAEPEEETDAGEVKAEPVPGEEL
jgi:hypothetical protein